MSAKRKITGTSGNDKFLVSAPTAVDGRGGVDTIAFDFSTYQGSIHLDLEGVWSGGTGILNGYAITNVEVLGSGLDQTDTENRFLFGSEFSDFLRIGSDFDQGPSVMFGLGGDDTIFGGNYDAGNGTPANYLNGGGGDDAIHGGSAGDTIIGEEGNDRLFGHDGNDLIFGDAGRDRLVGGGGDDSLLGGADADRLAGGSGNDLLDGGSGADRLSGGTGADVFRFSTLQDIEVGDLITDFAAAQGDKIDLSGISAQTGSTFNFVGSNLFSGSAGEVRAALSNGVWLVSSDVDGNGDADFVFSVRSDEPLTQADFVLI